MCTPRNLNQVGCSENIVCFSIVVTCPNLSVNCKLSSFIWRKSCSCVILSDCNLVLATKGVKAIVSQSSWPPHDVQCMAGATKLGCICSVLRNRPIFTFWFILGQKFSFWNHEWKWLKLGGSDSCSSGIIACATPSMTPSWPVCHATTASTLPMCTDTCLYVHLQHRTT